MVLVHIVVCYLHTHNYFCNCREIMASSFYLDNEEEEVQDIPNDFKELFLSSWKVMIVVLFD